MNKIKFHFLIILLAVVMVGCQNKEYKNIVPKNANMLVSVDLGSLFKEVEVPQSAKSKLMSLAQMVDKETAGLQLEKLLEGENHTGIDCLSPFYIFRSPEVTLGLTLRVADEDDLEQLMATLEKQNVIEKPVEFEGLKLSSVMGELTLAFDEHSLLLMVPENKAQSKILVRKLFNQSDDDSFIASEKFEKITEKTDPVVWFVNGAAFQDVEQLYSNIPLMLNFLPDGVRPIDVNLIASFSSKKGRADATYELFSLNKKTQKLLEKEDKKFNKINGDFISAPNDFFVWAGAGVEGDNLLKMMKGNSEINPYLTALDRAIDIQAIIKSIKGDMALILPSLPQNDIDFVLTAKTKNTDFLKDVSYWNETMKDYGLKMRENSKNNFTLFVDGEELNWGVEEDNVYFASKNSFFKTAFSEKSSDLSKMEEEITNSIAYVYINLKPLAQKMMDAPYPPYHIMAKQLTLLDKCCFKMENFRNCTVSFFIDSDENFLTKLLDVVAQSF